ncbi:MAG: nucleotidyltransferase [Tidjanibacter sp.]|nr:nucleotidyltransferase [Tidjanibacter sp.]
MAKPTLLVLAAGMASRYGSLKQMDGVGPNGEAIIDYSIYDAIRAGFGKVVFVIRHLFEEQFKAAFPPERFGGQIEVEFVFQELDALPEGYTVPEDRVKPWGTNHAVMMGATAVNTPFAVINADDFYGKSAFQSIADYLRSVDGAKGKYALVGYCLKNTLSEFGTVSRGACSVADDGTLLNVVERTAIKREEDGVVYYEDEEGKHPIDENTPVSMNMWGFTPDYFAGSEVLFKEFLDANNANPNPKAEYYIPWAVEQMMSRGEATTKVLSCDSHWFGVTYQQDRPDVVAKINALVEAGEYPEKLWK